MHNNISIESLNDIRYPDDYLWNQGSAENTISGTKVFRHLLSKL